MLKLLVFKLFEVLLKMLWNII